MPVVLHHALSTNKITEARSRRREEGKNFEAYILTDGDGLYLDVDHRKRKGDTHIWRALVYVNGRRTKETFGPYPQISIDEARGKLAKSLKLLAEQETGAQVNPSKVKRELERATHAAAALVNENARRIAQGETPVGTVWYYVEEVARVEAPACKHSTIREFLRVLTKDAKDTIGHMPIADVKKSHIDAICTTIRERGKRGGTPKGNRSAVNEFRDALRKVFRYAFDKGAIEAIPIVEPLLANRLDQMPSTPLPAVSTVDMLGQLLRWVGNENNHRPHARDAFFLGLATGQRPDTVYNARWKHKGYPYGIDLDKREWHIARWTVGTEKAELARMAKLGIIENGDAGERKQVYGAMKGQYLDPNDAPHVVPLSTQVCEMLQRIMDQQLDAGTFCGFVFPSDKLNLRYVKGMSDEPVAQMLRQGHEVGHIPKHVMHGNRAVMRLMMCDPDLGLGDSFEWINELGQTVMIDTHLALEVQIDHTHGKMMQEKTAGMSGVYYRGDMLKQRRVVMQAWSDLIERIYNMKPAHEIATTSRLTPRQQAALDALAARKSAPATFLVA